MIRRPPRSTLFPTRRSSDLRQAPFIRVEQKHEPAPAHHRPSPVDLSDRGLPENRPGDRKSTRLNSSHSQISYAVFCLKKKNILSLTELLTATRAATPMGRGI